MNVLHPFERKLHHVVIMHKKRKIVFSIGRDGNTPDAFDSCVEFAHEKIFDSIGLGHGGRWPQHHRLKRRLGRNKLPNRHSAWKKTRHVSRERNTFMAGFDPRRTTRLEIGNLEYYYTKKTSRLTFNGWEEASKSNNEGWDWKQGGVQEK